MIATTMCRYALQALLRISTTGCSLDLAEALHKQPSMLSQIPCTCTRLPVCSPRLVSSQAGICRPSRRKFYRQLTGTCMIAAAASATAAPPAPKASVESSRGRIGKPASTTPVVSVLVAVPVAAPAWAAGQL